jgi:subfamily B ATP-binding cassette protein MsbA
MSLPHAYDTRVGEGGHKLSQGERQRLSIARAFCKDAPVIVLDEATSSLDTACEGKIQTALANLLEGRTAFVIAHRLATVIDADLIVVMDSGRIVESGTHRELISDRHGTYSRLAASQLLGAETGDRLRDQGAVEPTRLGLWARTARSADAGLSQAETRSA